tara:strand:+ start:530 stop:2059 length:1530 start_codon:yes stop_codon:yes gene_type:complete
MVTPIDQLNMGLLPMRSTQLRGMGGMGSSLLGPILNPPATSITPVNIGSQLAAAAQPTALGRVRGALSKNLFDPAMLRGLASGLLTGPTRTPVSMGQRLTTGLLAGQQMKEAEEDKLFKRMLLEREADLATQRLNLLGTQIDVEQQKLLAGGVKGDSVNVRLPSGVTTIGREDEAGNIFVQTEDGQLIPAPFGSTKVSLSVQASGLSDLTPTAQEMVKSGLDLSKDSVVLPDGRVQVVPGSKTAEELRLKDLGIQIKNDQFELSEKEFETATKFRERELALKEGAAAREDSKFRLEYDKLNFAFQQEQDIAGRKKENAWNTTFAISTKIDDILKKAEQFKPESVFGPTSILAKAPIIGASTPQGQVAADLETLKARLVKDAMDQFRAASSAGATGFGALNMKELGVIESLITNLNQAQAPQQIMENLRRLKSTMDSIAYGVVNKGKFEDYKPTLHNQGLLDGSILPATKQNSYLIGAPSVPGYTFKQFNSVGRPVFINKQGEPVYLEGY